MYAGMAHTSLYESVFSYYNFKQVLQIYNDMKKEPLYSEKELLTNNKSSLLKKYRSAIVQKHEKYEKYEKTKKEYDLKMPELKEKIQQIDNVLSKMSYSDRTVNLMNSDKTVNYLITDFLSD